jgi:2,4-dienoyl-CoA reductase-like NADH-dependent reductase (Old Yellow Enzyme family)
MMTGNVFVDPAYLGMPKEVSIPPTLTAANKQALAQFHDACSSASTPTLVQLNHAGRQSQLGAGNRSIFAKSIAPSPVPLNLGPGLIAWLARVLLFGTPRAMTDEEIETVIDQFVHAATVSAEAGFEGVELHAAHGYLLAQFMSRRTNLRRDKWGGDPEGRVLIVTEIIKRIRAATPKRFAVGVKLNSADHQNAQAMEEALVQVQAIVDAGPDFIEISGGTWEDPEVRILFIRPSHTPLFRLYRASRGMDADMHR